MTAILEKTREARCKRAIEKRGGVFRKLAYVMAGDPDRLILMPGARAWLVEFKRDGKQASKLQRMRLRKYHGLGFNTKIVNSETTYLELINEIDLI